MSFLRVLTIVCHGLLVFLEHFSDQKACDIWYRQQQIVRASPAFFFFFLHSSIWIQYNQKSGEKLERPGNTYEVNASGRHEVDVHVLQGEGPHIIHCAEQRDVKSEFAALWSPFQLHLSSVFHYRNLTPQVQRAWPENSPRQSSWLKDVTLGCEMDVLLLFFWGGGLLNTI